MLRQGDVVLQKVKKLPAGVRRVRGNVLARGEATEHAHRVVGDSALFQDRLAKELYVKVMSSAVLLHEEHGPISIPAGIYRVVRQREYTPEPIHDASSAMGEQLTFRVPGNLADKLEQAAREMRRKRSEVLRLALEQFLEGATNQRRTRPFELIRDLLGGLESGVPDLGQQHRAYIVDRLRRGRSSHS